MPERSLRSRAPRPPATARVSRLLLVAAALAAAACAGEPTAGPSTSSAATPQARAAAAEQRDLATLRAGTARFHRLDVAKAAGFDYLFLGMCMDDAAGGGRGGMGEHWVDTTRLDARLDVAAPEALLYEPGPNAQRRLVGVEYVIPAAAWSGDVPPRLFGRDFTLNAFGLWALHVWVWKDNPSGLYADWNPRVSCEHAPVAARTHH